MKNVIDKNPSEGFKYGLNLYLESGEILMIEKLATKISAYFDCATICDASRLILKEKNTFYSLLFEQGKFYLVDDYGCEDTGQVTKIIELTYDLPET